MWRHLCAAERECARCAALVATVCARRLRALCPSCLRYYDPDPGPRPYHIMNMQLEAKRWLQKEFPYWDRRGGRDHIFLMAHDEGAWCDHLAGRGGGRRCRVVALSAPHMTSAGQERSALDAAPRACCLCSYASNEVYSTAIMLTHWGRTDEKHKSGARLLTPPPPPSRARQTAAGAHPPHPPSERARCWDSKEGGAAGRSPARVCVAARRACAAAQRRRTGRTTTRTRA